MTPSGFPTALRVLSLSPSTPSLPFCVSPFSLPATYRALEGWQNRPGVINVPYVSLPLSIRTQEFLPRVWRFSDVWRHHTATHVNAFNETSLLIEDDCQGSFTSDLSSYDTFSTVKLPASDARSSLIDFKHSQVSAIQSTLANFAIIQGVTFKRARARQSMPVLPECFDCFFLRYASRMTVLGAECSTTVAERNRKKPGTPREDRDVS